MTEEQSPTRPKLSEEEIDTIVEMQADEDSAWEKPIQARKRKSAAVSVTKEPADDQGRLKLRKRVRIADD